MDGIKVLAFDTGGTILDWHSGIVRALAQTGVQRGVEHDWPALANEYRRRSLRRMLGAVRPDFNIDDVHRQMLDELLGGPVSPPFRAMIDRRSRHAGTSSMPGRILC